MKFCSTFVLISCLGIATENELVPTADCTCPGENITYKCSVFGGRFTVWGGTVMGDNCEVSLSHSMFMSSTESCKSGEIVGQGIMQENDRYTSKLFIQASSVVEGSTVSCSVDDGSKNVTPINSTTLHFTTKPYLPPVNVQLIDFDPERPTFSWTAPPRICPTLTYYIWAENCGNCPNTSVSTNVTCTCENFVPQGVCRFSVKSVICGNLTSTVVTNNFTDADGICCAGNAATAFSSIYSIGTITALLMVLIT